jgi:LacI family transcriptional regulator
MNAPDPKRATLRTVAEMTGLSLSTVSLSLRDGSNVKASTRKRVAEAAKEVGYVPNRAGVRLRTGRTNVLALILSSDANSIDFTRLLIQGIGEQLQGTRYHLNVVPEIDPSDPVAAVKYVLDSRSADGIILTHTGARDPRVRFLLDAEYPFVSHGRTEFYTPHPFHDFHAEAFIEMAVERIAERGRRRVVLAAVDNQTTHYAHIVSGFHRVLATTPLVGYTNQDPSSLISAQSARSFGTAIAHDDPECDAIICNHELTALAVISGMLDGGKVLGRDYDLICKQTTDILPTLYPQIDTIAEDLSKTGAELANLLIKRANGAHVDTLQSLQSPSPQWRAINS